MPSDTSHQSPSSSHRRRQSRQHANTNTSMNNGRRRGLSLLAAGAAVTAGAGLLASPLCSSPTAVEAASTAASPKRGGRRRRHHHNDAAGRRRLLFHEHEDRVQQRLEELERAMSKKKKMAPVAPLDSRIPQNDRDIEQHKRKLGIPDPLSARDMKLSNSSSKNSNLHHKVTNPKSTAAAAQMQSDRSPHSPSPSKQNMVGTNSGFPDSHALNSPKPMTVSLRLSLPSVGQSKGQTTQEDILEEQAATIQRIQALLAAETEAEAEADKEGFDVATETETESTSKIQILGQTQLVLNSIFLRFPHGISKEQLHLISTQVDGIKRISPMGHYKVQMLETESHVGAKMAQNLYGYDGTGVRVAVLDTGVDYTHKNLGGPGTVEAYIAAMGVDPYDERNKKRDNLFPTVKVVDGYDFVGELSAGEDDDDYIQFDDDPIDAGGHGTSVADTIAGMNGIAPGADIIALKVCAGQGGCPGLSIAMGIEWAVKNSVDILNLSLGSDYGKWGLLNGCVEPLF